MSGLSFRTPDALTPSVAMPALPAEITAPLANPRPRRVLMLCSLFTLAYRALRCFAEAETTIYCLGNRQSGGMRYTRFCAGFTETSIPFDGTCNEAMIAAVNAEIVRLGVDLVVAGDQPATRSLIAMSGRLGVPYFPMPDLTTFDLLNNKAEFTELCLKLDILCPPTQLVATSQHLLRGIADGSIGLPVVVKPLSLDGNRGVIVLASMAEVQAAKIAYQPVLVQSFIPGIDIGASVFAMDGRITAYICHQLCRATYTTLDHGTVAIALARIVKATGASGILNFDMRLAPDGRIFFLECNPRVFYKMNLSMLAGVNFAAHGLATLEEEARLQSLPAVPPLHAAVRMPKGLLAALATPWRITRRDLAMLGYILSDPMPYLREIAGYDWEDRSY